MNRPMHKVIVAEDEPLAREALVNLVMNADGWMVTATAKDGAEALEVCLHDPPDLLIADIRMPKLDGLELATELRAAGLTSEVVFVTAHDAYALSAFRVAALDYLLKPVTDQQLFACLARARARLLSHPADLTQGNALGGILRERRASMRHIAVRSVGRIDIVSLADVMAVRAQGNYAELVTSTRNWLHRETMTSLGARLDPQRFVQIHRSTIVASAHVDRIVRDAGVVEAVLRNGLRLRASPRGVRLLQEVMR